jgi:3-oxoacyl-[acyl-carrier-protein] synthase III
MSLIISSEFPIDKPGLVFPNAFQVRDSETFRWKAAAFTLGEIATATLIDARRKVGEAEVKSENQHNQLCVVPIKKPHRFMNWTDDLSLIEDGCFIANGERLASVGFRPGLSVLKNLITKIGEPDFILPHAFSDNVPKTVANHLGVAEKLHNVFQKVGNISTSSIPFSLWSLAQSEDLTDKSVVGWVASAGMKHAAFQIEYTAV